MHAFTIGQAAKAVGVGVETIRFYERKGLIAQPLKPVDGGPRDYGGACVQRLQFIRQAQEIGFSLSEISELLSLKSNPRADCAAVHARAKQKRQDVEAKLSRLLQIRDALDALIADCPGNGSVASCTILDVMEQGYQKHSTA